MRLSREQRKIQIKTRLFFINIIPSFIDSDVLNNKNHEGVFNGFSLLSTPVRKFLHKVFNLGSLIKDIARRQYRVSWFLFSSMNTSQAESCCASLPYCLMSQHAALLYLFVVDMCTHHVDCYKKIIYVNH